MRHSEAAESSSPAPDTWQALRFPPPTATRARELTTIFAELRIPAVVSTPQLGDAPVLVYTLRDRHGDILALADTFGPVLHFVIADRARLDDALARISAPYALDEDPDRVDAIAWFSTEAPEVLRMVAHRLDLDMAAIDAGTRGAIIVPVGDPTAMVDSGVWASGVLTLWRVGERLSATMTLRGEVHRITWSPPWTFVDPGRPGQLLEDGSLLSDLHTDVVGPEPDTAAWEQRFALNAERAEQLRVLSRRLPSSTTAQELVRILDLPEGLGTVLDADVDVSRLDGYVRVIPVNSRGLFSEQLRRDLGAADGATSPDWETGWWRAFGERHPIIRLSIAVGVAAATSALAIAGFASGRPTAALPAAVAVAWWCQTAIDLYWLGPRRASTRHAATAPAADDVASD